MWDFIICEILSLNYIAPVWFYQVVFKMSMIVQGLLLTSFLMDIFIDKGKFGTFMDKILTSDQYFIFLGVIQIVLIWIAPQKQILISLGLSAVIFVCLSYIIFISMGNDNNQEFD